MKKRDLTLGIDTGGTYTDAVILEKRTGAVLAWQKAPTTYEDFSIGITTAVRGLFEQMSEARERVSFAALSTTLATNAAVEGRILPHALLLIGYDRSAAPYLRFENTLRNARVHHIAGGHDDRGNERMPLDETAILDAARHLEPDVRAVAISSLFGVRNPTHEQRAREIAACATGLPVTCGHEISSKLDAYVRATTVSMNAGLIPVLTELLLAVRHSLRALALSAPLMVVRGDGTLVNLDWAAMRPMETLLSGPVASAKGGCKLLRRDTEGPGKDAGQEALVCVVDMGGTTSDLIIIEDGAARVNPDGARVGAARTHISAVDVRTFALGGDIFVSAMPGKSVIGDRRVLPLARLGERASGLPAVLDAWAWRGHDWAKLPLFLVPTKKFDPNGLRTKFDTLPLERGRPVLLQAFLKKTFRRTGALRFLDELERCGEIIWSSFTPTDALHVLGRYDQHDTELPNAAARVLASAAGMDTETFCLNVLREVHLRLRREVIRKALRDEVAFGGTEVGDALLDMASGTRSLRGVEVSVRLAHTLIGIGAPAAAYIPEALKAIARRVVVPEHAMVAGAVGAASGGLRLSCDLMIVRERNGRYRALLPEGPADFDELQEAKEHSVRRMEPWMISLAESAGAKQPEVVAHTEDLFVKASGGADVFLHSIMRFEVRQETL